MIYRDLPLPDGGSIVRVGYGAWPNFQPLDAFELAGLRAQAQSVDELGGYRDSRALVGEAGASRSVLAVESDWRIFEFTRVQPLLGRGFVRDDGAAGAEPVAVLGYATWQSAFAGDAERRRHARENQRAAHAHRRRHAGRLWLPDEQGHLAADSGGRARTGRLLREKVRRLRAHPSRRVGGNGRGRAHRVGAAHEARAAGRRRASSRRDLDLERPGRVVGPARHRHLRRLERPVALDSALGRRQHRQPALGAHERAHE